MSAIWQDMDAPLSRAECCEIERHKWFLSQRAGHDVGLDIAREDWLRHHAERWRRDSQAHMLALQRDEINRHKWIESEKASRDLGRDACMDWIRQYAAKWRDWYDHEQREHI